jgi:hypothetical protein
MKPLLWFFRLAFGCPSYAHEPGIHDQESDVSGLLRMWPGI